MNYKDYNDYELLSYVAEGDDYSDIIFEKYKPKIVEMASKLMVYCKSSGIDLNDLIQEGMLGLNDAIVNFNESKDTSFYTFAIKCIKSKMISAIVKSRRLKNKALNCSVCLEINELDKNNGFGKTLVDNSSNPENILMDKEAEDRIFSIIDSNLNDFEKSIINLRINGFKYREIADILGKDLKLIDNTFQKIKKIIKEELRKSL